MTNQLADQRVRRLANQPLTQWLILAAILLCLVVAESFALHAVFTSKFSGGNDFFVRWLGGREYLLHGTNPYDRSVAEKAQMMMFGRVVGPEIKDQAYFAYPLYTLYFFWPLSLLPYAWAQAIWMTLLQLILLGITLLSIRMSGWRPPRWLFVFTLFWGILFYNGARAIILGQFSILVGLALFLALWAIEYHRDGWAGFFLALTTIKPQMVFMVVVFLLLWALTRRRWRIIASFAISMLLLITSSMLLVPTWPLDFIHNAIAYTDYVAFGTPLENLLHYFLSAEMAVPLALVFSSLFFLTLLPGWWLALRTSPTPHVDGGGAGGGYTWAITSTLIVGSLITFRSATANQMILYLPLFFFFRRLTSLSPGGVQGGSRWNDIIIALIEVGLAVLMWGVFIATLEGNWEHVMMHGLLPALMFLLYAIDWRALWRTAVEVERR